jgi:hypothetical protein
VVAWRQQKQSGPGGRRIKYQNRSVASSLFGGQRAEKKEVNSEKSLMKMVGEF